MIAKVPGEEEERTTKIFYVRVRSLESKACFLVSAVGIPYISSNISEVGINEVAKFLGQGEGKFNKVTTLLTY